MVYFCGLEAVAPCGANFADRAALPVSVEFDVGAFGGEVWAGGLVDRPADSPAGREHGVSRADNDLFGAFRHVLDENGDAVLTVRASADVEFEALVEERQGLFEPPVRIDVAPDDGWLQGLS